MMLHLNGHNIQLNIEGERAFGDKVNLLSEDDDLTQDTEFAGTGYALKPFLKETLYQPFMAGIKSLILRHLRNSGLRIDDNFNLTRYHRLIGDDYQQHLKVIERTKLVQNIDFPIDIRHVENRISDICKVPLKVKNPLTREEVFHFRIVRPHTTDHNPLHRDVWQHENRHAINLYIPLAGSNELSSLTLVPGSHRWTEDLTERTSRGAIVNKIRFNVPGLTRSKKQLDITRPNPAENEVLVFSPYLIHGGAINLNEDTTRISLEMRLWRKK